MLNALVLMFWVQICNNLSSATISHYFIDQIMQNGIKHGNIAEHRKEKAKAFTWETSKAFSKGKKYRQTITIDSEEVYQEAYEMHHLTRLRNVLPRG
jgi:hypothetical protein